MLVRNDLEALELKRNYSWIFKLAEVQRIPEAMRWISTQLSREVDGMQRL